MSIIDYAMADEAWNSGKQYAGVSAETKSDRRITLNQNTNPLKPIADLKAMKEKKYDEDLKKINFLIQAEFMYSDSVKIYPSQIRSLIDEKGLINKIEGQGYKVQLVYGLEGKVDYLEISGW